MIDETYTAPKSLEEVVTELEKIRTGMNYSNLADLIEDMKHLVVEDKAFQEDYEDLKNDFYELELKYDDLVEDYNCLKVQAEGDEDYF